MKKSFDYFKTFKIITENLNSIFKLSVSNQDFSKQYFMLIADKNEILDNLKNDFITPIERGDIFILCDIFSREMCTIGTIYEYSGFTWSESEEVKAQLQLIFDFQVSVFQRLYSERINYNLFSLCNDGYNQALKLKKDIYKYVKSTVTGNCEKPLLRYVTYVTFLELSEVLIQAFSETGRIILNNG